MFTCSMVNLNHQDLRSDSSNWSSLFQAQDRGGPSEDLKTCSSYVKMQNYYLIYSNMCCLYRIMYSTQIDVACICIQLVIQLKSVLPVSNRLFN